MKDIVARLDEELTMIFSLLMESKNEIILLRKHVDALKTNLSLHMKTCNLVVMDDEIQRERI